ncbi:MAG: hypothetical protein ACR2PB_14845 [Desulfocapsaceae bacterium]
MSLLKKISSNKFVRLLKLSAPVGHQPRLATAESLPETSSGELSLERIKDLIIEAYSALDGKRRMKLLERADQMEAQLVSIYRARGLQITADNICDTLETHRKRHCNRCS